MSFIKLSVILAGGIICCGQVLAQSNNESVEEVDNIIVTASRTPLAAVNVGSSTTVITREQIERRQSRYVSDLLRAVPGFSVSHSGTTGSQTQVRVRGAEANHVLVLIDGVRANDPATGDEFRWELLSTNNIERIEIVRGPQSSLWGSDAVAAVVHVITQSGGDTTRFGAFAEGGSNSTANAGLSGSTGGDRWSLGYGLERLDTDGTNISRTGSEEDNSDLTTASLSARFRPFDGLRFDFGARVIDAYAQFDPVDFDTTGLPLDGDVASESDQAYLHVGGTLGNPGDRLTHDFKASFMDTSNNNLTDGILTSSSDSDRLTFAYQANISLSNNLLALALEHERTNFEQRGQIIFGDPNHDQRTNVNSAIFDVQGHSIDRLTWLLSFRYDDHSDFDNALTGRLSLAYELTDSTRLRANVGTAQKTPTFTERFGFFPGQFVGNANLKPESSTSFEIGVDRQFLGDAFELQLTIFEQDLEDEINGFVFDPDTFLSTAENILGDSSRSGVEFAAIAALTDNFEITASYTYTDSNEESDEGIDARELRRPRHAGNLSGNYRFFENRGNVSLVADYGGSRSDIFFPPFPAPSEIVTLDSFWLLDLTLGFDLSDNVNVYTRVNNLLDEDYEQVYGYRTPGIAGYVGVRVNFGN